MGLRVTAVAPAAALSTVPSLVGTAGLDALWPVEVAGDGATDLSPATWRAPAMAAPILLRVTAVAPAAAPYTASSQAGTAGPAAQWPVEVAGDGATDLSPATWRAPAMAAPASPRVTAVALAAALSTVPSPAGTAGAVVL